MLLKRLNCSNEKNKSAERKLLIVIIISWWILMNYDNKTHDGCPLCEPNMHLVNTAPIHGGDLQNKGMAIVGQP